MLVACELNGIPNLNDTAQSLEILHLEKNYIIEITDSYFEDFISLKRLFLAGNSLVNTPNVAPLKSSLIEIDMDQNR